MSIQNKQYETTNVSNDNYCNIRNELIFTSLKNEGVQQNLNYLYEAYLIDQSYQIDRYL